MNAVALRTPRRSLAAQPRASHAPRSTPTTAIARLQQRAGNQTTHRVVAPLVQRQQTPEARLNLESPRFSGDPVLEAVFDDRGLLRKGNSGAAVRKVQQALIDAGFPLPKFGADSVFGAETEAAVKAFQRAAGLEDAQIDGIVGPNTLSRLDARFTEGSAIVPERHCDLGFRTIPVAAVVFHGFTESPQSYIDHANEVFKPCCIAFSMGSPVVLSEQRTRSLLDGDTTFFTGDCDALSVQERRVVADPAVRGLTKPFKVLFVERLEGPRGRLRGTSTGPTCALLGRGPLRGFFMVAQGAGVRTMPHEFSHYLMSVFAEHRTQATNLQHTTEGSTGEQITSLQCDIMFTRALEESI